ncbi:putative ABC transporter permease [Fulvivirga imtechensis AK7]|uniref:Putative ABC transporter permease n=1 Tax=Fulvivirga imtechensis AK7 TaxID=1237149 RepID=L8JS83_9BACT|nr:ABC transporter permease [Fulvivirga imtechensis]ELR70222.1 putative ABC transporter permease [Fulvivirga imtechensis AK7]
MLKNYFLVTFRNLYKNSAYSIINIAGLAIGITCSILILLWVDHETSYDKFLPKNDRLYQVWVNAAFDGKINSWRSVPLPTYEAMKTSDANIVNSVVTGWGSTHLLRYEDTRMNKQGYFASKEFLEMFQYPLTRGSAETVLDDPYSIVLTESAAKALFGDEDPIDKMVRVDDQYDLKVTGILKDIPTNSSFQFEYLIPWEFRALIQEWVVRNQDNWGNYSFQIFIELNDKKNEKAVSETIRHMLTEKGQDDIEREFFLHPLLDWRLKSNFENGVQSGGMSDYVRLFTVIAIFILFIACINFMNLATARSERRAKEVGIRKSVGSNRWELIMQFLGESVFITFISFVIAILIAYLVLPAYNQLVEKQLYIDFASGKFWLAALSFILFTGIIAGSYPAFYLSGFQPARVLKGQLKVGKSASTPRKVLVTLQFGVAILLIIGTLVIYKQIQLVQNRELGYSKENLITVLLNDELSKNYSTLKTELEASGDVESVTKSNSAITSINSNNFLGWPGKPEDLRVIFTTIVADYDYSKTMGIKILEGRDFSKDFGSDTSAIIINKAALELMGLEDPIGTQLDLWGDKRPLIGVVDDVLMGSLYDPVKPMFIILDDWGGTITLRLKKTNDLNASLAQVQSIFEKHDPAHPFEYTFVDDDFKKKFTTINLTSNLASIFATLAIIITGLGLFGLASFTAEQKTKEIGIRKVLGASIQSLVALISGEFSRLVIISFVISAPLAWWLLNQYLERYPIRTGIAWWIFPLTGLIALTFALLIVAYQAWNAARANPVKALRSE